MGNAASVPRGALPPLSSADKYAPTTSASSNSPSHPRTTAPSAMASPWGHHGPGHTQGSHARHDKAAKSMSSTIMSLRLSISRRSNPELSPIHGHGPPKNVEILYEIDPMDIKLYRTIGDGDLLRPQTDVVWASIPGAVNGRSARALLVDRSQRLLSKWDHAQLAHEVKTHALLAVRFGHEAQVAMHGPAPIAGVGRRRDRHEAKLQELQHPHIVRLYGHFTQLRVLHVLTEFCQAGNVETLLDKDVRCVEKEGHRLPCFLDDDALERCIAQVTAGLAYVHESSLAHTNLHPANVFLGDTGVFLIGDFKLAVYVGPHNAHRALSSDRPHRLPYTAPELLTAMEDDGNGDHHHAATAILDLQKLDAWSLGMFIFVLITRIPLFRAASAAEDPSFETFCQVGFEAFLEQWRTQGRHRDAPIPAAVVPLLAALLEAQPLQRCSVLEARERFPWLVEKATPPSTEVDHSHAPHRRPHHHEVQGIVTS